MALIYKGLAMEEKTKSISFRPTRAVEIKLKRYMAAVPGMNKTDAIIAAIECGVDTLESIGWDVGRDAARRRVADLSKPLESLPDVPPQTKRKTQ